MVERDTGHERRLSGRGGHEQRADREEASEEATHGP